MSRAKRVAVKMTTFGFIGTGHLGSMVVRKFTQTRALEAEDILASKSRGIREDLAERLVKQTLLGTALLLENESFRGLIMSVATKGGIT
jgi:pyrroline-5-carboxylate reductase